MKIAPEKTARFFEILKEAGTPIEPNTSNIQLPDESDRVFYDMAKTSDAILITGNIKHYPVEPFIMTPADFLRKIDRI